MPFKKGHKGFITKEGYRSRLKPKPKDPIKVFLSKIRVLENGCWEWTGHLDTRKYGRFFCNKIHIMAHKFSYIYHRGEIPKNLELDHLCRNHWCVNPDHLEAVTHRINVLRGISVSAIAAQKTHCKNGHLLEGNNIYKSNNGLRRCIACNRERERIYRCKKTMK